MQPLQEFETILHEDDGDDFVDECATGTFKATNEFGPWQIFQWDSYHADWRKLSLPTLLTKEDAKEVLTKKVKAFYEDMGEDA